MQLNNIFNKLRSDIFISGGKRLYYNSGLNVYSQVSGSISTGQYDLRGATYTKIHVSGEVKVVAPWQGSWSTCDGQELFFNHTAVRCEKDFIKSNARFAMFDPDIERDLKNGILDFQYLFIPISEIAQAIPEGSIEQIDRISITGLGRIKDEAIPWGNSYQADEDVLNLRRINERGNFVDGEWVPEPLNGDYIKFVIRLEENGDAIKCCNRKIKMTMAHRNERKENGFDDDGVGLVISSYESIF